MTSSGAAPTAPPATAARPSRHDLAAAAAQLRPRARDGAMLLKTSATVLVTSVHGSEAGQASGAG